MMNIYLLTQTENRGWDTFDSCVVMAPDEDSARKMHPRGDRLWDGRGWAVEDDRYYDDAAGWAFSPDAVTVEFIGVTFTEGVTSRVVCSSFNAG